MTRAAFDTIAIVDWSGGNDTGPRPRKDAIWIAVRRGAVEEVTYCRNRGVAEAALAALIEGELAAGRRLMIGFDFPFGYPAGFARAVTGSDDPLALWHWLSERVEDAPKANTRFDLGGALNLRLTGGLGPFWGNGLKRDIAGLPRRKTLYQNPFPERRWCETRAKGAFPCWQLSGAGAVGGQVLMGLPVLWRLRARFAGRVAVWPFEDVTAPVLFTEVWPSLIAGAVAAAQAPGEIKDRAQVRVLAEALARVDVATLLADVPAGAPRCEEGWILGLGHEVALADAVSAYTLGMGTKK